MSYVRAQNLYDRGDVQRAREELEGQRAENAGANSEDLVRLRIAIADTQHDFEHMLEAVEEGLELPEASSDLRVLLLATRVTTLGALRRWPETLTASRQALPALNRSRPEQPNLLAHVHLVRALAFDVGGERGEIVAALLRGARR